MLLALYYGYFLTHVTHMRNVRNEATHMESISTTV